MAAEDSGEPGKIFLRVPETLKQRWVEACADGKIGQNDAGMALVVLALNQDPVVRAQMFGQIPAAGGKIVCVAPAIGRVAVEGRNGTKAKKQSRRQEPDANHSAGR